MGTNYYLKTDVCECCGRERERVHIGKSSSGWPFLFRGYRQWPPDGVPASITSAAEWRQFLEHSIGLKGQIVDEYGRAHSLDDLWSLVVDKRKLTTGPDSCSYKHGSSQSEWYDSEGYRFSDSEFS